MSGKRVIYEEAWKDIVGADGSKMTIWRMRIACWITKATDTHTEYVSLIAFPLQQWLCERASVLRYTTLPVLFTFSSRAGIKFTS